MLNKIFRSVSTIFPTRHTNTWFKKKGIKRKKEELLDSSYETYFYLILNPFHPDLLQPRTKEAIESRIESKEKM